MNIWVNTGIIAGAFTALITATTALIHSIKTRKGVVQNISDIQNVKSNIVKLKNSKVKED
jgi:predicted RNA-binding protein with RPS1 domain